ncbi:MAG: tRNA uridine-5-carboxymethylaminomethyl(34) synthesis GTPase MnmE [Bacteroidales bacterium]|nr:tRNA uridine-5-carboxymethylaminomethyl(34) synthesis GTPase MnmE [Bacteroidales bacterium]
MRSESTICALATSGNGAIAVIRISGPDTYNMVDTIFLPSAEGKELLKQKPNTIHFGTIRNEETTIDEVLVSLFKAPHSYTGEDAIEISCHGSPYIQQRILELLIGCGAQPAKPGEFTQRAFLNGKMDLSQAEAVADLIAAESEGAHRVALQQLRGGFSGKLKELRAQLLHFISMIELELDFSEEDVEFADRKELISLIHEIEQLVNGLINSFQLGNVLKHGVPVAIIGRPNVGKSTLLNAILNEERAIVSEIEGTTRDAIEDTITFGGINFRFIDTAGIRESADIIENLGIRRTYQKIEQASIVLLLTEASDHIDMIHRSVEVIREQLSDGNKQLVVVLNKSDRISDKQQIAIQQSIPLQTNERIISISAEMRENIDGLTELLLDIVNIGSIKHQDTVISNIRHYNALKSASEGLSRVSEGLASALPSDLLAQDIREVLHYMGEITGEVTTDEILGNIFKNFCIGK